MGVKYTNDGKIEDLDFCITITNNCNLSCNYCPLTKKNISIEFDVLDSYINFLLNNEEYIQKYVKNIVIIFFGGEALLNFDKIKYFLSKMYNYGIHTKYVIYTNGLLINNEILDFLKQFDNYRKRIIFSVSIDGDYESMLKNRLKTKQQLDKIIKNLTLLKENNFDFSISKVIYEDSSLEILKNFNFLNSLKPNKLDFLPVSFYHKGGYTYENIKEIIKGLDLFINNLLKSGKKHLEIMEYLGLPDSLDGYKKLYKSDYGLFGDLNGDFLRIIDALSIFETTNTFNIKEQKNIKLANIKDYNKILEIIGNYKEFEEKYFELGKKWHEREFKNEIKLFNIISIYLIKKLLIYKYKALDLQ